jgi:putative ABC transport system permease protein
MLNNYLRTAFRNLWKNKGFSFINIMGLAIGLATCLLIILFVMDELHYDRFNKKADRIYRLDGDIKFGGNHFILAVAPAPGGPALLRDYPEVEKEMRFRSYGGLLVRKGNQNIKEQAVIYADSTLFDVFTLPLISGDPHTALREPHTLVITEKIARKYFNSTDVVGRTLVINDSVNYKVTGVMENLPSQCHFQYDIFVSLSESEEGKEMNEWVSNNFNTYLVLKEGADARKLEAKFPQLITKYVAPVIKSAVGASMEDFYRGGNSIGFSLTPLTSIHLHSNKTGELGPNGSIQAVYIFSAIAFFILLIACVNFMNLSTARSANRAKEVGIRKVLGSMRGQLIGQFIAESVVVTFISMILALGFAWLFLPVFNDMASKEMTLGLFSKPWLIPSLIGLVFGVGLLAGSYPAFYLSSFRPILVLKGKIASGFRSGFLRNALVVGQFMISIFLMVGTTVIYRQLNYIRHRDLGFDREHVLVLNNTDVLGDGIKSFRDEMKSLPGVTGATISGFLPTGGSRNDNAYFLTADMDTKKGLSLQNWDVDDQYIPVLGMKMAAGRNFSRDFPIDSDGMVLNEAAMRLIASMNPAAMTDPTSLKIYELVNMKSRKARVWHVIGVVKDFNFSSMREVVTPLALAMHKNTGNISLRIQTDHIPRLISQVEDRFHQFAPTQPFSYSFMDDDFNSIYKTEQHQGKISLSFSLLAIFIACLGLFGLAAYAAEQRTREIGIRKVLGASVTNIVRLLSRDFLLLIGLAMIIAFPLAWLAMHYWLLDFAYRVDIGWQVFVLAAALSTGIALLTISFQAIKAALADPVQALRAE